MIRPTVDPADEDGTFVLLDILNRVLEDRIDWEWLISRPKGENEQRSQRFRQIFRVTKHWPLGDINAVELLNPVMSKRAVATAIPTAWPLVEQEGLCEDMISTRWVDVRVAGLIAGSKVEVLDISRRRG